MQSFRALGVAALVFGVGVAFTVFSALQLRAQAEERLQLRFLSEATERYAQVRWRIRSIEQKIALLGTVLAHEPEFDETRFRSLAEPLLGDVLAFSWVPIVPHEQRSAFETRASAMLGRDYAVLSPWNAEPAPAPVAEEYFPVLFIVTPHLDRPPYGFDLRLHSERYAALDRARQRGSVAVTEVLDVRGYDAWTPGVLLVQPVFAGASQEETGDAAGVRGFVIAAVGLDALFLEGFRSTVEAMHLTLYASVGGAPVFGHGQPPANGPLPLRQALPIGDAEWYLELSPRAGFTRASLERSWLLLLGSGLLVSALVSGGLLTTLGQRQRALALVEERTAQLRDSELRWQYALESARDGVWDWNQETGKVFFSSSWKSMLGYADGEVGDTLDEWQRRVHPDDLPGCLEDLRRHFNGETPFYENEHRMLCRDGSYKWILDRGRVLTRADDGALRRVIGTHTDIDRQKQIEIALTRVNAELRSVMDAATRVAIIATDPQGIIQTFNRGAELMLGYDAASVVGRETPELIHDAEEVATRGRELSEQFGSVVEGFDVFIRPLREQRYDEREWTYIRKDGSHLSVSLMVTAMQDADGRLLGYLGVAIDISERLRAQRVLEARDVLLAKLTAQVPGAIYQFRLDADGRQSFPFASRGIAEVYEVSPQDIAVDSSVILERLHPEDRGRILQSIQQSARDLTLWREDYRVLLPRAGLRWLRGEATPESQSGGSILWHGYISDITASKLAEAELRKLAITDPLTGVFNRRHFQERLEDEMQRAQRYGSPLSLMMFDLDHFKQVNDRFGHERGDFVLRETCERVAQRLRRSDIFCRSGGEEFVVLCPETDLEQARALAESLLQRLRRDPFAEVGVVTASFGVTAFQPGETADAFLARVDHAMYRAKGEGRDRVVLD